jgi:hypothetical protein
VTKEKPQPLFILSLPRSGSTLLQHLLASHPQIATTTEPWILIPFIYALRRTGVSAEYGHEGLAKAVGEFVDQSVGMDGFRQLVRDWVTDMYAAASGGSAVYFLDKTPHYALIAEEVSAIFEGAKLIFLWRNPLAVAASITSTFGQKGWRLYPYSPHLFRGLDRLVRASVRHRSAAMVLRYEDLVQRPSEVLPQVLDYLGLEWHPEMLTNFADVHLAGSMKDPSWGRYHTVSPDSLHRWQQVMRGPVRKAWCRRYLRWIGPDRLHEMGYDYESLAAEVEALDVAGGRPVVDALDLATALPKAWIKGRLLKTPYYVWPPRLGRAV